MDSWIKTDAAVLEANKQDFYSPGRTTPNTDRVTKENFDTPNAAGSPTVKNMTNRIKGGAAALDGVQQIFKGVDDLESGKYVKAGQDGANLASDIANLGGYNPLTGSETKSWTGTAGLFRAAGGGIGLFNDITDQKSPEAKRDLSIAADGLDIAAGTTKALEKFGASPLLGGAASDLFGGLAGIASNTAKLFDPNATTQDKGAAVFGDVVSLGQTAEGIKRGTAFIGKPTTPPGGTSAPGTTPSTPGGTSTSVQSGANTSVQSGANTTFSLDRTQQFNPALIPMPLFRIRTPQLQIPMLLQIRIRMLLQILTRTLRPIPIQTLLPIKQRRKKKRNKLPRKRHNL